MDTEARMQTLSLRELFDAAIELAPPARAAFLAGHCSDPQLRAAIDDLLLAERGSADFFSGGAAEAARAIGDVDACALPPGSRVGPFELIAILGEGGSSTVFHARRDSAGVRHDVALKVLRRGVYSPDAQRQFRRERQALAQLRHAGIARLIEGGITDDGTAYIALELVDGKPITEFARDARLDLRARLELFVQVCRAVEAAHRALIVHRDLKPTNVLVTGEGQVKLLDFGIAKLLDDHADETRTKLPAFTAAYAAPEQRGGDLVTTATDVYALGVLLGELVTGQRLGAGSNRTPSSQVTVDGQPGVLPASAVATRRALRGDLDNIVLKAITAEPERRYASAGALADDIERFRDGRPVAAHPPSAGYRVRKFVSRHRGGVIAGSGFLFAIVAALGVAVWQAEAARRAAASADEQRNIATRAAARATATKDFLIGVFRASDPLRAQDKPRGQVTAKELLDLSVPKIGTRLAGDPQTQIELLGIVAKIYRELGDSARYDELRRQQTELARRSEGELSPVLIEDLIDQAAYAARARDFSGAQKLLDRADGLIRRARLDASWLRAYWSLALGASLRGDAAARARRTTALENAVKLYAEYGPTHTGYANALYLLGIDSSDDPKRAEQFVRRAIDVMQHLPEPDDSLLQVLYGGLASWQQEQGDYAAAERSYDKAAALARRTTGEHHMRYWPEAAKHARLVHRLGDRERALRMFAALLPLLPARPSAEEIGAAVYVRELYAEALTAEGDARTAVPLLLAVEEKRTQENVTSKFGAASVRATLADAYDQLGRTDEARTNLDAALRDATAKFAGDSAFVLQIRERRARFLLDQGDAAGAQDRYREILGLAHGRHLAAVALAHAGLARLALARNDMNAANEEIGLALAAYAKPSGDYDVRTGPYLLLIRADVQRRSGDLAAARESARRALEQSRRYDAPEAKSIRAAEAALRAAENS
jgi:serine/threonine-protein kinase